MKKMREENKVARANRLARRNVLKNHSESTDVKPMETNDDEESDSDDENDSVLKAVKQNQSKQNSTTFLVPKDLSHRVVKNDGPTTKSKEIGESNFSIQIAPGEGKIPSNLMRDEHFDVKAFPKHFPTGKFGLHFPRKHKLSAQMYFNQRLLNYDERFSKDPCFLFTAAYFIERQGIEKQISISGNDKSKIFLLFIGLNFCSFYTGMKGKTVSEADGVKRLKLEDMFDVFKKIKGTPKFWQAAKNDIIAKVKQLGPFHLFYTFSCGEMRWSEVFLSLLKRKGYRIEYPNEWNGNDNEILVEGKELWTYVNEEMSQSKHELFKDYTFLITRLFDARVKSFVKNILMGNGQGKIPLRYYSYRVEFQVRGK